jgi:hypothetical protein
MHHFAIAVCAGIVATVVVGGTALMPTSHRSRNKKVAKNGPAVKSRLGHKKLNCDAGIDS